MFCEWYCHVVLGPSNIWSHCLWLCTNPRLINMNEKLMHKVSFSFMDMELKCKDSDSSHFLIEKLLETPFQGVFLLTTHRNPVSVGTSVRYLKWIDHDQKPAWDLSSATEIATRSFNSGCFFQPPWAQQPSCSNFYNTGGGGRWGDIEEGKFKRC